jgi:hypothetical protein
VPRIRISGVDGGQQQRKATGSQPLVNGTSKKKRENALVELSGNLHLSVLRQVIKVALAVGDDSRLFRPKWTRITPNLPQTKAIGSWNETSANTITPEVLDSSGVRLTDVPRLATKISSASRQLTCSLTGGDISAGKAGRGGNLDRGPVDALTVYIHYTVTT